MNHWNYSLKDNLLTAKPNENYADYINKASDQLQRKMAEKECLDIFRMLSVENLELLAKDIDTVLREKLGAK